MIGMECSREVKSAVNECLKRGFLINCTSDTVMRFVPPLIVTPKEIDSLVQCLDDIFSSWS
jgi:acetylornithine/succinyldiaminopimelate/putrescine aminotransferase